MTGFRESPISWTGVVSDGRHHLPQRDDLLQALRLLVQHVDGVDGFLGAAHVVHELANLGRRPGRRHADKLRRHQSARALRRVAQEQLELIPGRGVEAVAQPGPVRSLDAAEQADLLVRRHGLHQRGRDIVRQPLDNLVPPFQLGLIEDLNRGVERKRSYDLRGGFRRQVVQRFDDVGGKEVGAGGDEVFGIAGEKVEVLREGSIGASGHGAPGEGEWWGE